MNIEITARNFLFTLSPIYPPKKRENARTIDAAVPIAPIKTRFGTMLQR